MRYDDSPYHILLVEDRRADADRIVKAVRTADPQVRLELAEDAGQALAYLKQWETDAPTPMLILLDGKLASQDGLQVLEAIKTHPLARVVPVVILAGPGEDDDLERAYRLGANSYILKSADPLEFGETIKVIHRYWCKLNVRP